jgi:hypothetical protein
VVKTPETNLVAGMKWFPGTQPARFNRRHRLLRPLQGAGWGPESTGYIRTVCEHVHLNPVRAGLPSPEAPIRDDAGSGFPQYLVPGFVTLAVVAGGSSIRRDAVAGLRRRPKGDAGRVRIARRVRRETTMTLARIANRLQMET